MPTHGLSLVGFMDQPQAIHHLRNDCKPANANVDDAALIAEWQVARQHLGAAIDNAGNPNIQEIPQAHQAHLQQILQMWQQSPAPWMLGASFKLVEIDPLLAYQFTVDADRSDQHCNGLENPSLDQLVPLCLPLAPQIEAIQSVRAPQSLIIRARSLNVQMLDQGKLAENAVGITFGLSAPFVHVVRFNNRCYLHNGFHRAYGVRRSGATHIPCVFRDLTDPGAVGIRPPQTFSQQLLESDNPPALGHFTQGRAHQVQIRLKSRVLHVSWAEYVVPEE